MLQKFSLGPVRLKSRSDFINLLLISCYDGMYPALKESGEWTVYLGRDCRFLDASGKCSIHRESHQSLICKTYDAHSCWYTEAFRKDCYSTMIPFSTERLIWFENKYDLTIKHFKSHQPGMISALTQRFPFIVVIRSLMVALLPGLTGDSPSKRRDYQK